ncbi:MAG TPA: RNase adapter RapZ [Ignavibacteriaceae bacterium]|nr:RNase adapter RapZ [Ignavibacteriaceae bacterium]
MKQVIQRLKFLYKSWAKEEAIYIVPLAQSGSDRKYFRINGQEKTAIGVFNPDEKENKAFISFTKHFLKKGLNVPKLYAQQLKENIYLIEDLGDTTLFSLIEKEKASDSLSEKLLSYYKDSLSHLIRFQIDGGKGLDYSACYPRDKFDMQSILWDLNYFKYYFLRLIKISFDEQKLESDFNSFSKFLLQADSKYFMYRDFQSRNILVYNDKLYFVDYQGGRKGALQYDVTSLLFQAKVNLSHEIREKLLAHYLFQLSKRIKVSPKEFKKYYYGYVLIRLLQTLGAYGFRGYYENKSHFLLSIPFALKNLQWLQDKNHLPKKFSELNRVLASILKNDELKKLNLKPSIDKLKVTINSFSYKEGIPKDYSGNGGGFVFDCRSLDNPGRYPEFKENTGLDENVIHFLNERVEVNEFLNSIYGIIDESVKKYIQRDFKNLMINFGCTGGQHRSVYCAENLAKHLRDNFDVSVFVNHTQLAKKDN